MKIDNLNFTQSVLIFNIRELTSWKIIRVFVYTTYKISIKCISIYDCKLTMDITNCVTCGKTKNRRCKAKQRLVTSRFIVMCIANGFLVFTILFIMLTGIQQYADIIIMHRHEIWLNLRLS